MVLLIGKRSGIFLCSEADTVFNIRERSNIQKKEELAGDCETAVNQIAVRKYAQDFLDGYKTVVCYGIAFFKKQCLLKRTEAGIERK